jgi:hypothetical protein
MLYNWVVSDPTFLGWLLYGRVAIVDSFLEFSKIGDVFNMETSYWYKLLKASHGSQTATQWVEESRLNVLVSFQGRNSNRRELRGAIVNIF